MKHTSAQHIQIKEKVLKIIKGGEWELLSGFFAYISAPIALEVLNHLKRDSRLAVFKLMSGDLAAKVFIKLNPRYKYELIEGLNKKQTGELLASLRPDEQVALFSELPAKISKELFGLLGKKDAEKVKKLLSYPLESVGRLMTPNYFAVREDWDIEKTLSHIRRVGHKSETLDVVFVVGDHRKLLGSVDLRKILLAPRRTKISQLMKKQIAKLFALDDREAAVAAMRDYDKSVLPVVDSDGGVLGIVTFDDVMDVAHQEATEDFHRIGAVRPLKVKYKNASISDLFKTRVPWLITLVLVNLGASIVIAAYETTLAATISLVFFIPLLIATGGNSGVQSATVIIRAVSIGDLKNKDFFRAVGKELVIGFFLALILGVLAFVLGYAIDGAQVGLVVGLSMAVIIVATNLIGAVLPFLLYLFRVDPAVASGPLITSVVDVVGLLIYFSIAVSVLKGLG